MFCYSSHGSSFFVLVQRGVCDGQNVCMKYFAYTTTLFASNPFAIWGGLSLLHHQTPGNNEKFLEILGHDEIMMVYVWEENRKNIIGRRKIWRKVCYGLNIGLPTWPVRQSVMLRVRQAGNKNLTSQELDWNYTPTTPSEVLDYSPSPTWREGAH